LLAGCSSPADGDALPEAPVRTGALVVENATGQGVFSLRFALVGGGDWGPDRLGGGEVLARGAERGWELPVGRYRVKASLGDGTILEGDEGYWVDPEGETRCVLRATGSESTGRLTLVNGTGFAIAKVHFSLSSAAAWGDDRLARVLPAGERKSWDVQAGRYNLRVEFQDGVTLEAPGSYEVVAGEERVYRLGGS
jgi:hypothetical protein